jgi:hypothetical protein
MKFLEHETEERIRNSLYRGMECEHREHRECDPLVIFFDLEVLQIDNA